jgi:protein-S-isoprenylcysteine O-methyltransferase Ste14
MSARTNAITPRVILQMLIIVVVLPFLPLIISGHWAWWEAWVYALTTVLAFVLSRFLAAQRHPDILQERARSMNLQDAKSWDRILAPALAFGNIVIVIVAGLDRLFHWTTPFSPVTKLIALLVILLGYLLGTWALMENRFFSGVVRIQKDRGHQVVSSGPYRFFRHPGYAGALWVYSFTPLLLDSAWAFIPAFSLMGILILRTSLEDRTLQDELPGYAEYARRTRYRLFPGIW